ncbi:MAG: DNA primase [Pseudomonadota bacterium]
MSLPPGFLDELRTRLSLTDVVGRKVMWDSRKSNQGKGDMWAPCPFHQEKTASFHVDDRKGYYYCFGCHAKGDAITFVRETENVSFMEAVEILAGEAGLQMPAKDPRAKEKADRRTQLSDVMELAVQHFRLQLKTGAASAARDYLQTKRGLSPDAQARWEIGFAPDAWQGLWDALKAKGVEDDLILGAGLAKPSQKGGKPYDTFRGRIMFPIRDARGRCIAFGGRAMDPNDNAKYLNSPETDLFDKSRTLYNHGPARTAAGKGQPLIVAEGYMDVIALAEHGFGAAVAPLGTAVTEHQLAMLWRIAPEPIIALDGDTAGIRAAHRVIDLSLPLLEAGKSLRFALMPDGQDPDDLLKASGAGALQKLLDAAQPMVRLLWQRETEGRDFDSPERKAALDKALRDRIAQIKDPSIRAHYGQEIKDLRWQLFRPAPRAQGAYRRWDAPQPALPGTKASALARQDPDHLREGVILAALICAPEIANELEPQLDRMACVKPLHGDLRRLILRFGHEGASPLRERISSALGREALDSLMSAPHVATEVAPFAQNIERTKLTILDNLRRLEAARSLEAEVSEASEDIKQVVDEGLTWRLKSAGDAAQEARRSRQEDGGEHDVADNGALILREERSGLDSLIDKIRFSKPGR